MDLGKDKPDGHIKPTKNRTKFLEFCRYLRGRYPPKIRIAIVLDNSPPAPDHEKGHPRRRLGRSQQRRVRLHANQQFLARPRRGPVHRLRDFALDGTDHASHNEQGSMLRRYIIWRNKHAADERLREVVNRANVA